MPEDVPLEVYEKQLFQRTNTEALFPEGVPDSCSRYWGRLYEEQEHDMHVAPEDQKYEQSFMQTNDCKDGEINQVIDLDESSEELTPTELESEDDGTTKGKMVTSDVPPPLEPPHGFELKVSCPHTHACILC